MNAVDVSVYDVFSVDVVHRVICGDVLDAKVQKLMMLSFPEKFDVIYSDLPWGVSMYHRFYNMAGVKPDFDYEGFLRRVVAFSGHVSHAESRIVFEMGGSGLDLFMDVLSDENFRIAWVQRSYYGRRSDMHPCWQIAGRFTNPLGMPKPDIEGQFGFEVVRRVMSAIVRKGDAYLDFCAGKLLYFECAMKHGAKAFGVELIPAKLRQGLERLQGRNHVLGRLLHHV